MNKTTEEDIKAFAELRDKMIIEEVVFGRDDLLAVAEQMVYEYGKGDGEALCEYLAQEAKRYFKNIKPYYSVWVGGGEVNENYFESKKDAEDVAQCWKDNGYDDVYVETIYM